MAERQNKKAEAQEAKGPRKKQAVILIHGIGEQRPMDTLRGFVEAVWRKDPALGDAPGAADVWSKPDTYSRNLELRCLTTRANRQGTRTDFFEVYWAHLVQGTSWTHVMEWVKSLRGRDDLPPRARIAAMVLVLASRCVMTIVVVMALLAILWLFGALSGLPFLLKLSVGVAWGLCLIFFTALLVVWWRFREPLRQVVGDAARYLSPLPSNIEARSKIRKAGIELIDELHQSDRYDRIIVVGHSLGSVIGYDLLTYSWPNYNASHIAGPGPIEEEAAKTQPVFAEFDQMLQDGRYGIYKYRAMQRKVHDALKARGNRWLVTDFVTLGSPLAHANVVLADSLSKFVLRKAMRELPTSPPELEKSGDEDDGEAGASLRSFCYPVKCKTKPGKLVQVEVPHHAAVFSVVRWTNLYFPIRLTEEGAVDWKGLLKGDPIGGPIVKQADPKNPRAARTDPHAAQFEASSLADFRSVMDVPLGNRREWPSSWHMKIFSWLACHTKYWSMDTWREPPFQAQHLEALRRAVNLQNEDEPFLKYMADLADKSGGGIDWERSADR